ncbi:polysaccharide biosynthesis protein [Paenibacillus sp. IB182496]|uniref:Polysaccharide biosynthesis protein n=1 Tax=Paenibacillus sabuli TaxID=2772509 RepID=A0A927BUF0_9BACL|nr:polysaccharide biosynthesis protein [Paenibacillus sabuli]MBD2845694.1 polysaccharide biosynthesis protein [Paenibacillus sabuli]
MIKKDSLLKGTVVLAAAALIARFLGIFQRVPLDYLLDPAGIKYFNLANTLYLFLLVIATAGIPSTVSKMVSERYAQGRVAEAQQVYRAALLFGGVTGLIISALLFVTAPFITAHISKFPGAKLAVQAIAPSLLLFPVLAMMRGYFQGRQMMSAGAISQIVEQVLRVVSAIGLLLLLLGLGYSNEWLAAGAAAGSVAGSIGAFVVMLWYARKLRRQDAAERLAQAAAAAQGVGDPSRKLKLSAIYGEIFRMAVPIVMTAATVQFLYMVDVTLFVRMTAGFYDAAQAELVVGWLGNRAQPLASIPPILAIALSQSIIPAISSAYAVRNMAEVQRQGSLAMRIVLFTGIPAALALTVAAVSVTGFIFEDAQGSLIVAALTAGTIFQITMMTSNSMLFGLGKPRAPMLHTMWGMAVKVAGSLVLGPLLGVYGLILASTLCFVLVTTLNLRAIRAEVSLDVLGGRWARYAGAVLLTAAAGVGVEWGARTLLAPLPDKLGYFFSAAICGVVILGLYLAGLVLLRVVTPAETAGFPGPVRKLFGLLFRVLPTARRARG